MTKRYAKNQISAVKKTRNCILAVAKKVINFMNGWRNIAQRLVVKNTRKMAGAKNFMKIINGPWNVAQRLAIMVVQQQPCLQKAQLVNLKVPTYKCLTESCLRNMRFMLDEMHNAKRFKICHISYIQKPKVTFSVFHFKLLYFFPLMNALGLSRLTQF